MATNDPHDDFRTALEISQPAADVRRGADSIQVCQTCCAWTGHEMQENGRYRCLACADRDIPTCADGDCDQPAALVVDGGPRCGSHGRARVEGSAC